MSAKPKLYQFSISPSCQRVFATFAHKGVEYDVFEVDVSKKERPEEFNQISPFGKVPVLVHNGQVLVESAVICQYINDVWPDPPMLPADPAELAYARQWIVFADRILDKDAQFTHIERDRARKVDICNSLFADLSHLERELGSKDKFFLGGELSLVDCIFSSTMAFLPIWSKIIDDTLYNTYPNIQAYTERLRGHPTLEANVYNIPAEVYEGFFGAVLGDGLTVP